jgi:hypothetical protein
MYVLQDFFHRGAFQRQVGFEDIAAIRMAAFAIGGKYFAFYKQIHNPPHFLLAPAIISLPQFKNLSPVSLLQRPFSVIPAAVARKAGEKIGYSDVSLVYQSSPQEAHPGSFPFLMGGHNPP